MSLPRPHFDLSFDRQQATSVLDAYNRLLKLEVNAM